jgi:hypothetical protein
MAALCIYLGKCTRLPDTKLKTLQDAVGGNIESLPIKTKTFIAYVDEEGFLKSDALGLSRNISGELLLSHFGLFVTAFGVWGPIVIVGRNGRALTAAQTTTLEEMLKIATTSDDAYEGPDDLQLSKLASTLEKDKSSTAVGGKCRDTKKQEKKKRRVAPRDGSKK